MFNKTLSVIKWCLSSGIQFTCYSNICIPSYQTERDLLSSFLLSLLAVENKSENRSLKLIEKTFFAGVMVIKYQEVKCVVLAISLTLESSIVTSSRLDAFLNIC